MFAKYSFWFFLQKEKVLSNPLMAFIQFDPRLSRLSPLYPWPIHYAHEVGTYLFLK